MEFALARGAAVWRGLERGIDTFSLENVISLRSRAADLRRSLDTVIMHADRRTDQLRQGKTQMKMPDDADWVWRPDVFATRLGQMSSVGKSARHGVGTSIAVHHNDNDPELIVRQFKTWVSMIWPPLACLFKPMNLRDPSCHWRLICPAKLQLD